MYNESIDEGLYDESGDGMRKALSFLLIVAGVGCLLYGGWQLFLTNAQQKQALEKARELVSGTGEAQEKNASSLDEPPQEGDVIGVLNIPRLEKELPIVHGTDEDDLARGVGHYATTALPNENDQILLSGHRDTVFRRMGELELGDELVVEMSYGTFTYKISDTDIVDADDTSVIRTTAPDEILTLSTCYPFTYVGSAPDRYIIYAERLP